MSIVTFHVRGTPAPQGSHRAFVNRRTGRAIVTDDSPATRPWRTDVRAAATEHWSDAPWPGAIELHITFRFARPRGHTGKRGLLPSAPDHKTTKPDLDKLLRSTLDALTGIVIRDDAQVVGLAASKMWADDEHPSGAMIEVLLP